jgi:hypothetical protein
VKRHNTVQRRIPGRWALNRRAMLRGMMGGVGVAVGLPILESMLNSHGTALAGGGTIPVRMITWFFGNGVNKKRWVPGGLTTPIQGADYPISEALVPLTAVKDYVSIPTGFANRCGQQITHHEGMTLFNGFTFSQVCLHGPECNMGFYSNAGGPTIDQIAAGIIGTQTPVPSIQVGVSKRISGADFGTSMHALSHKSTSEPLFPERNPQDVFYTLFGSFMPQDDPAKPSRIAVLNAVKEQAARLNGRLGVKDRQRLDAHLQGISELEAKINSLPPACVAPGQPSETNTDVGGVEPLEEVNTAMSDLIAYAFSCDVTRIASVLFHEGASDTVFPGTSTQGHHGASHGFDVSATGVETDFGGLNDFNIGLEFTMTQFAYLLTKLQGTPDGTGTLLDNCAILAGSDCMDGWSHDFDQWRHLACIVAGGGGGRLVHPGIHTVQEGRNISDVALTVLQAVVPDVTSIGAVGSDPAASSTPVAELLGG